MRSVFKSISIENLKWGRFILGRKLAAKQYESSIIKSKQNINIVLVKTKLTQPPTPIDLWNPYLDIMV
jgi:hypothetical protein